ncbi:hypothetical protein SOVF_003180 [Spinacia oleracea]|nr:hypothetical protein SOVF_003180 [Spinacia oleracea]
MGKCRVPFFLLSIFSLFSFFLPTLHALPLSTSFRWIVDEKGQRVKLACVNWPSHLDLAVAEGLTKQPVDVISKKIKDLGFNCVRFTWPLYLATNNSLASSTVRQSFTNAGISKDVVANLQANNPSIVDLSLINAFKAVVGSLSNNKVMVILDNHISKPGWCCADSDGNSFFGDKYFNPNLWVKGLTKMATLFKDNPFVVGMSLRNELRGPMQNTKDWYRYMQQGAEQVHKANPNVLVIISGLSFDTNLSFLKKQPLFLTFTRKLVFEVHHYSFTGGPKWRVGNANQVCADMTNNLMQNAGFLMDQGFPLFVGEWGLAMVGTSESEERYLNCFLGWAMEYDLDWGLWTLSGSYNVKLGEVGAAESFGLLNRNWTDVSNEGIFQRISTIQPLRQGPETSYRHKHKIIFHPATGLCILKTTGMGVQLGNCSESNHWDYTPQNTLAIEGSYLCLQAQGSNRPARLTINSQNTGTKWVQMSDSKLHLATELSNNNNTTVCLDVDSGHNLITNPCKCLSKDIKCDPGSQWFKIADACDFY